MASTNGTRRRNTSTTADTSTIEAALRREIQIANDNMELLAARLEEATAGGTPFGISEAGVADLERALIGDPGWRLFTALAREEFSLDGLRRVRAVCRLMSVANPMIKRGLNLRSVYVWGQGCEIRARADGKRDGEQDVQAVLAAHIADPGNQRTLYGAQARDEREHDLGTEGEVYLVLFTRPRSGWVSVRTIPADEITDVITDPDDASCPWYYRRRWYRTVHDDAGVPRQEPVETLYPDVDYTPRPGARPRTIGDTPIAWDSPVVSVAVNRINGGGGRGIPDAYAAVNWARAYKEFLEQWAGLMKSLARFAWRQTVEGRDRTQARTSLAAAAAGNTSAVAGQRNDIGGIALTPIGGGLEAIPKTGATIDAESGRPLAAMTAAGLDVPVTMLLADPGQQGNRATAETLDWPTELAMMARRSLWTACQTRIAQYVITESVRAGDGALKGKVVRDQVTDRETVTLAGDTDTTVDVEWPPLDEIDPKAIIDAVVAAAGTGTIPPELILKWLLKALGERELSSILDEMVDEDGNFRWPQAPPIGGAGQQAADLARAGADPATAGPGRMGPDGQPVPGEPGTPAEVPGVSAEAAARQADADFGLFGGRGADDQADDDQAEPEPDEAGPRPADIFDPAFFEI
jgi:hypothetical protein